MIVGVIFVAVGFVFVVVLFPFGLLIPHLWVGMYFAFGRFFIEEKMRSSTTYAGHRPTSHRAASVAVVSASYGQSAFRS
jgi:hypothetical protein